MNSSSSRFGHLSRRSLVLAASLLALSLLMPPLKWQRPVHRYLLTFDISQSMNVADVPLDGQTVTRLTLAKAATRTLLQRLPCGSKVGWNVFTGARVVMLLNPVEVCAHYAGLVSSLDELDGRMRFENASSVGKGLHQSLRAADAVGDHTAVVMFTDGHEAPPLANGQRGIPRSENLGVPGFVIGVGGDVPVRIPKSDAAGRRLGFWQAKDVVQRSTLSGGTSHEELSSLHIEHLSRLAQYSDLTYRRLDTVDGFVEALSSASFTRRQAVEVDSRWLPAALALALLVLRFGISTFAFSPRRSASAPRGPHAGPPVY